LEGVEVPDDTEGLARQMLKAAWKHRLSGFSVGDVVVPRDPEARKELGYEWWLPELWRAEQWLEDRGYVVPVLAQPGSYIVTPAGRVFMEG